MVNLVASKGLTKATALICRAFNRSSAVVSGRTVEELSIGGSPFGEVRLESIIREIAKKYNRLPEAQNQKSVTMVALLYFRLLRGINKRKHYV